MRRFYSAILILLLSFVSTVPTTQAQSDECVDVLQTALIATSEVCAEVGRNEVCYGSGDLSATAFDDAGDLLFASPGDTVPAADVATLSSSALSADSVGVTALKLQLSLPDEVEEDVTVLAVGNVEVENLISPDAMVDPVAAAPTTLTATAPEDVDVYYFPMGFGAGDETLPTSESITVNGRTEDDQWLRFTLPDDTFGWVQVGSVTLDGDLSALPVVDPLSFEMPSTGEPAVLPAITPMLAFNFRSNGDTCGGFPSAGLMVQTPAGLDRVLMVVNGTFITARDATFFLQTHFQSPGETTMRMLNGSAKVESGGDGQLVSAGQETRIPLDEDGMANGAPAPPADSEMSLDSLLAAELELAPLVDPIDEIPLAPLPIDARNTRWIAQGEVVAGAASLGWSVPFMVDDEYQIISGNGLAYFSFPGQCVQAFDVWDMYVRGQVVENQFFIALIDEGSAAGEDTEELNCSLGAAAADLNALTEALFQAIGLLQEALQRLSDLALPTTDGASRKIEVGNAYSLFEVYLDPAPAAARNYGEDAPLPEDAVDELGLSQEQRINIFKRIIEDLLSSI